ncbi:MAG: bifunctional UDP-3-O-[3-hydroxymyristoyl] N-acetylglucosamine deacetylase/3-hydroxyacyl-ACP dehydratase [Candidatus Eisenbacteria bacterium]|nr:bifunctional UDP-3-O-[3-hydroxymyristoyl] N-acetylglucosamine deacetylase/3-hydroxyacyl-ACP dehydratase [Candidatus Latescibacterota bacterium]MBD3302094.1 bifunctional UDP-3-O-[3-hydroxymyristoyl] N-acetylglucosamine deacetylase/3-hydroxyacyl-ACP dehydratase [Candidatus Eisenbacteria bacterium]
MSVPRQRTVAGPAAYEGVGLHTGIASTLTVRPAEPDSGLRFLRADLPGSPTIPVNPESAGNRDGQLRRTVLRSGETVVHTVEHVLATLAGLGIDNALIEVTGPEAPEPVDGSARPIVEAILSVGTVEQDAPRRYLRIEQPTIFRKGPIQLAGVPEEELRLSFTIEYDNPIVGTQHASYAITPEVFATEIAPARTFVMHHDVEALQKAGMIKGGTLRNAVVVKDREVLSEEPLRFPDEFVRHKILDLLGDLSLLGRPLLGHILAIRSGHDTNVEFVRKLAAAQGRPYGYEDLLDRVHFDIHAIERIMPHRYPMLLVDRILLLEERKRVVGLKNVTLNEPFFSGHFPGHPIMPAVLIIEAMAQVGGVLLLNTVDDPEMKLVYFMGIDNAKFRRPVQPGDQLVFDLELIRLKSSICKMKGRGFCRGQLVAEADLLSKIVDR